jgi:hypothetical protein
MPPTNDASPFVDFLLSLERGALVLDLGDRLREVVQAVEAAGAQGKTPKGTLTLTLTVANDDGILIVRSAIGTKKPERPRPRAIYFATAEGDLTVKDPRQMALPLAGPDIHPIRREAQP